MVAAIVAATTVVAVGEAPRSEAAPFTSSGSTMVASVTEFGGPIGPGIRVINTEDNTSVAWMDGSGTFVTFSTREILSPDDTNTVEDVYVRNVVDNTFVFASKPVSGMATTPATFPSLARDGDAVAFMSSDTAMDPDSCGGHQSVYVRNLATMSLTNVTPTRMMPDGQGGMTCVGRGGEFPILSADGTKVVFASEYPYDEPLSTSAVRTRGHLYLHDLTTGTTTRVTVSDTNPSRPASQYQGSRVTPAGISDDGRYVAFLSNQSDMTAIATPPLRSHAYVRDLRFGKNTLVSRDPDLPDPIVAKSVAMSGDGNTIAWVPENGANARVFDLATRTAPLLVDHDGDALTSVSYLAVSADGSTVAATFGANVIVHDVATKFTERVDVLEGGPDLRSTRPWLTEDGRRIAFAAQPADTTDPLQLYLHDVAICAGLLLEPEPLIPPIIVLPPPGGGGVPVAPEVTRPTPAVPCPVNRLIVTGVEVTQGIQSFQNDVELVGERTTWVRVHARMSVSPQRSSGQLVVRDANGREVRRLRPIAANATVRVPVRGDIDRTSPDDSFNFLLPSDLRTTGQRSFEFVTTLDRGCQDPGRDCRSTVEFRDPVELPLELGRLQVHDGQRRLEATNDDLRATIRSLENFLPITRVRVLDTQTYLPEPGTTSSPFATSDHRFHRQALAAHLRQNCGRLSTPYCYALGVLPGSLPSRPGQSGTLGAAVDSIRAATTYVDDDTPPHEVGHLLGRAHVNCNGREGDPVTDYPYTGGKLANSDRPLNPVAHWPFRIHPGPFRSDTVRRPTTTADVMSYCTSQGTSDYTWAGTLDRLRTPPSRSARAPEDVLHVSGVIDDTTVTLSPLRPSVTESTSATAGSHVLAFVDNADADLATHGFDLEFGEGPVTDPGSFDLLVPLPSQTAGLEIRTAAGQVLLAAAPSANDPTVDLVGTFPSNPSLDDTVEVRWNSADVDGDVLVHDVDVSYDEGATWVPLAAEVTGDRIDIPVAALRGGTARLRVVVHDGWRRDVATSTPIAVPTRAPDVILEEASDRIVAGQVAEFRAFAVDPDDGVLDGAVLAWRSDLDGPLDAGDNLTVLADDLTAGTHTISVTATDTDGESATASRTLVVEARVARLAGDTRLTTAIEISRATVPDSDAGAVVLSRADFYADALAGTPLAAAVGGPLLLTPTGALDAGVLAEIRRVLPGGGTVHVLGGTVALSAEVSDALTAAGFAVERYAGDDRYDTAARIATAVERMRPPAGATPVRVLLADGTNFPDALAAGTAAASANGVVLLTAGESIPDATRTALEARPDALVHAIGGPAARAGWPGAFDLIGDTRIETATQVQERFLSAPPVVGVASARNFPDALAGGAALARLGGALLLAEPTSLPDATADRLSSLGDGVAAVKVFGGEVALFSGLESEIVDELETR